MSTPATSPMAEPQPKLSPIEQVINIFASPSRTFEDLRDHGRGFSWIVPFIVIAIFSSALAWTVGQKVGWDQLAENNMRLMPKFAQEQIDKLPEARKQEMKAEAPARQRRSSYLMPVFMMVVWLILAGIYLAAFNFGLGAELKFKDVLNVILFSSIPIIIKDVLAIVSLFAGANTEGFLMQNPVMTNPGFFVDVAEHPVLFTALSFIDAFSIWAYVLMGIGFAIVGKVKKGSAMTLSFAVYAAFALILIGITSLFY